MRWLGCRNAAGEVRIGIYLLAALTIAANPRTARNPEQFRAFALWGDMPKGEVLC
jgi:hypothetical protein